LKIWWKKDNNSKMGTRIYFKIAGYVDLHMLNMCAINLTSISYNYRNIVPILELLSFFHQIFKILIPFILYFKNYKRQMVSWNCKQVQWVIRFTSKLQGRYILMCWSFLPHGRFLILLTVFELLPKTCNFTICSIFSNSGHVGYYKMCRKS
jgi:hypothetical protein